MREALIEVTADGLFCRAGGFFVDPWRPVPLALITHAHSDHARPGSARYVCQAACEPLLRLRLGAGISVQPVSWGERITIGDVRVSFHPAGHVLGSAQIRVERGGEVWVVSGDYKLASDATCDGFEPVRCHTFITESTFGLPVYRWAEPACVAEEVNRWWAGNAGAGVGSVIAAYSLGKTQRLLSLLDESIGPILLHGAATATTEAYRAAGVRLPSTAHADRKTMKTAGGRAIVLAPQSALSAGWLRGLGEPAVAAASGWMRVRGARRRGHAERGFVLSDHADWPGLLKAIHATGAERVGVTHGFTGPLVRWLTEQGREAFEIRTRFAGEQAPDVGGAPAPAEDAAI